MAGGALGNPGDRLLIAALALAAAIVGGSFWVRAELRAKNAEIAEAVDAVRAAAIRAGGGPVELDPRRRYAVDPGDAPARGPEDAAVTLVEWGDFECPFCRRAAPTLQQVRETWPDDVRIVFKHMPLPMHRRARSAHRAAEAARRQGRFWEMHDRLFGAPDALSDEALLAHAREIGLDLERFERDLADPTIDQRIDADIAQGAALGIRGTPSFFVNGRFLSGAKPFERFEAQIEDALKDR